MNNSLKTFLENDCAKIDILIEEIAKYNVVDFIMGVSALMMFPQNQAKSIIFQTIINSALTISVDKINSANKISITKFKKIVREFEKLSISLMVDPPEFPFILPVLYFENPYVFMGNNSLSPIYLSNVLKVLEINKKNIGYYKYIKIKKMIKGLLSLSNYIVKSLKIGIDDLKSYAVEKEIFIPDKQTLDNYKEYLHVSYAQMENIFGDKINDYIMKFGYLKRTDIIDIGNPKFIFHPFINYEDNYILLDVTCILPLIFRNIIKETYILEKINIIDEYNKLNSLELTKVFLMLGSQELTSTKIEIIKNKDYEEKLFLIGNDGIIINIQLFDIGKNFNFETYDNITKFEKKDDFIFERISYLSKSLTNNKIDSNKIFVIISPYSLGRDFLYSLKKCDVSNILILSLYELNAIAINEGQNRFFLEEYIDSRKKLKGYHKSLFSELNTVALFTNNNYSFYARDDLDVKDVLFHIIGEYSSDYILKSYLRESKQLCYYTKYSLIEVIKIDKSIYFAPQLFLEKKLNKVLIDGNSTIWIVNNIKAYSNYNLYQWLSDLISYWLCELLPFKCNNYHITIELNFDNQLLYGIEKINVHDDISSILKFNIENNELNIYVTEELCNYFDCGTNNREKEFIKYLLDILGNNFSLYYDRNKFEKVFNNPYKRKTISIDSISNAYMIPSNNKEQIQVSKAQENIILDEIGLYLKKERKYDYGIINDKKILNYVVDYLYKKLVNNLKKYNKKDLIYYLYEMYDSNLGNLIVRQHFYANDITCYPEHKQEIEENINNMNQLSVALKFMIELVSTFKDNANDNLSYYNLNYGIAVASQIIEWAYSGDLLHYNMINSEIRLLDSNRIGFDKTSANRINLLMKKEIDFKNSVDEIEIEKRINIFLPKIDDKNTEFDKAFLTEFGYSYTDYTEVTITILELFKEDYDNLLQLRIDDIKNNVKKQISSDIIKKILDSLSLEERDDFLIPPKPYSKEEVYPWRFNRAISLTRKPLIKYKNIYLVGYRTLINSVYYLLSIINNGMLHAQSKTMKDYEAKMNNIKGKIFNDQVFNYLSSFDSVIVRKNVKKINKNYISDQRNNSLGDIDILYICIKKKTIGIIETKNFNISRNYYEIFNEYKKMFDRENPKCFYNKHKKRVEWVKSHIDDIIKEFNLPDIKWKVKDLFVVENYIISNKVFDVKANICTLRDLTEKKLY